jgi:hypothetical protein
MYRAWHRPSVTAATRTTRTTPRPYSRYSRRLQPPPSERAVRPRSRSLFEPHVCWHTTTATPRFGARRGACRVSRCIITDYERLQAAERT